LNFPQIYLLFEKPYIRFTPNSKKELIWWQRWQRAWACREYEIRWYRWQLCRSEEFCSEQSRTGAVERFIKNSVYENLLSHNTKRNAFGLW